MIFVRFGAWNCETRRASTGAWPQRTLMMLPAPRRERKCKVLQFFTGMTVVALSELRDKIFNRRARREMPLSVQNGRTFLAVRHSLRHYLEPTLWGALLVQMQTSGTLSSRCAAHLTSPLHRLPVRLSHPLSLPSRKSSSYPNTFVARSKTG